MRRLDGPTVYNPFGWRLAELATGPDADRRQRLREELIVWEAYEVAHGYRHLTIEHGDPETVEASRRLSAFYDQLAALVARAAWRRVRGTADYVTVTVAGADADAVIERILAVASATEEHWTVTPMAVPSAVA